MKIIKLLGLLAIVSLLSKGCVPDDGPEPGPEQIDGYSISTNPYDPLLLEAKLQTGETIHYYGAKNELGEALNCSQITISKDGPEDATIILLDENSRPKQVFEPNGASIEFNWVTADIVRLKAYSADGEVVVSAPYDFNNLDSNETGKSLKNNINRREGRLSLNSKANLKNIELNNKKPEKLVVNVSQCEEPFTDGYVRIIASANTGEFRSYQRSSINNSGSYEFNIATESKDINLNDICSSFDAALSLVCAGMEPFVNDTQNTTALCTFLSTSMDVALLGPTGEGVYIYAGCEGIIRSLGLACSTLSSPIAGADGVLSKICNLSEKDDNWSNVTFTPTVHTNGYKRITFEKFGPFPIFGPYPEININIPNQPKIGDLSTIPVDPAPGQDYSVQAQIYCAIEGQSATILVQGTDGFSDSITTTLPKGNSQISLNVPGADANVRDLLKVQADGMVTLNASIIF